MKSLFLLINKAKVFFRLRLKCQILIIEAFCLAGFTRLAMVTFTFKKFKKLIGKHNNTLVYEITENDRATISYIRWAVILVSRYTPWQSKCLVQAVVARLMLKRRNIESTLHLGIGRDKDNSLLAHAWLSCNNLIVIGESKDDLFKEVAKFL